MSTINYLHQYDNLRKRDCDYSLSFNRDEILHELYCSISPEEIFERINSYPSVTYSDMKELIRTKYHVNHIVFGSGSEELIFRINQTLLAEKRVGVLTPSFYRTIESLKKNPVCFNISEFVKDNMLQTEKLKQQMSEHGVEAMWITNPNSVYGNVILKESILKLIEEMPDVQFMIDEVSIDFTRKTEQFELFEEAEKYENLIVIKSMSKYYGIPGLRLAMLSSCSAIVKQLEQNSCVYPVNNLTFLYLERILQHEDKFNYMKEKISRNVKRLKKLLEGTPIHVLDSAVNTVFLWSDDTKDLWELLEKYNVLTLSLKDEEHVFAKNSVRVTIHSGEKFNYLYQQIKIMKKEEYHAE